MSMCVRCGQNWGKGAYEGEQETKGDCVVKRSLWGEEISELNMKCPVP